MNYMRYFKSIIAVTLLQILILSCTKDKTLPGSSSLTVINAVVNSNQLVTNFSNDYTLPGYYKNAQKLSYGSYSSTVNVFGSFSGATNLTLYQIPDTMPHSIPLYNLALSLPVASIHTLFLTGLATAPDTLFTTDQPPYHSAADSTVGVRFVNLSPGSNPVNITLSTSTTVNEFNNITYKGLSTFKNYPAISSVSSYTFQFRDATTNAVIASFTMSGINNGTGTNTSTNNYRWRNVTIALIGSPGGAGTAAQKTLLINNY